MTVEVLTPSPRGAACREQAACLVLVCISPWHPGLGPDCCRGWVRLRDFPVCLVYMGEVPWKADLMRPWQGFQSSFIHGQPTSLRKDAQVWRRRY